MAAFQESDDRLPAGPWQRTVLQRFRCDSMETLLSKVKTGEISHSQIAALAPMVIQLAQAGVQAADDILERAVQELVRVVAVTRRKANLAEGPVVLVGGLLENSEVFRNRLVAEFKTSMPELKIQQSLMTPIVGAVVVACKSSADALPEGLKQALIAELVGSSSF